jgi:DNA-binding CsgD family transcriptional regulator
VPGVTDISVPARAGHLLVQDAGPPDGLPVLVYCGSLGSRHLSPAALRQAGQKGLRLIGVDSHPASSRVHLASGLWLTLRAARLAPDEPGARPAPRSPGAATIVVTIEEVSAASRLDLFVRASGLTTRENELLSLLATGSDTRAMARRMKVSEHTVQDHLKSIFAKTGGRDRVTVLSRALGTRPEGKGR